MCRARSILVLFVLVTLALAACASDVDKARDTPPPPAPSPSTGGLPWPAPSNPLRLIEKAGLEALPHEFLQYHVHAHLDVFVNGQPVTIPAGIGINIDDPGVRHGTDATGPFYGGIQECVDGPCISPLHTHDQTGVLHTESPRERPNTLGEFFTEWDVRLNTDCVGGYCKPEASILVFVNGQRFVGDPTTIQLTDQKEIAIVIGSLPAQIPTGFPPAPS
jgi:hypothetical protein